MWKDTPVMEICAVLLLLLTLSIMVVISDDTKHELAEPIETAKYTVYQTKDVEEYKKLLSEVGREAVMDISISQYSFGTSGPYELYTVTYEIGVKAQNSSIYQVKEFETSDDYMKFIEMIEPDMIVDISITTHAFRTTGPRINYIVTYVEEY